MSSSKSSRRILCFLLALLFSALSACAPASTPHSPEEVWDPIEPINRGTFWFNNQFDNYVFEPVAKSYNWAVPNPVRNRVGHFFQNLEEPKVMISSLFQAKFRQFWSSFARLVTNSTIGVGGMFDVADEWGLPKVKEDFGTMFANGGAPAGPYIVLPILGPSNLRDGLGFAGEIFASPIYYIRYSNANDDTQLALTAGLATLRAVDIRAGLIETVDAAKEASLDYYLFAQSAYYQQRHTLIHQISTDDYDFDDEFEDEFEDEEEQ